MRREEEKEVAEDKNSKSEKEPTHIQIMRDCTNKCNLNHINLPLVLISRRGFLVATMEHLESNLGAIVRQDVGRRVGIYPATKASFYISENTNPPIILHLLFKDTISTSK